MLNIIDFDFIFLNSWNRKVKCNISVYDECFIRVEYDRKYACYIQVITNNDARAAWALYNDHIEYTGTEQELINALYIQYKTGYTGLLFAIVRNYITERPESIWK
jgi:hypothetical protein